MREILQQALGALKWNTANRDDDNAKRHNAIAALEAELAKPVNEFNPDWDQQAVLVERIRELETELAKPEQEPVTREALIHHAQGIIRAKVIYDYSIKNTQLEDDIAVSMAEFAMYYLARSCKLEQEPVAWVWLQNGKPVNAFVMKPQIDEKYWEERGFTNAPLYVAPPRKEWVGLTDEEKNGCLVEADPCEALATPEAQELMRSVEARLKEKNT